MFYLTVIFYYNMRQKKSPSSILFYISNNVEFYWVDCLRIKPSLFIFPLVAFLTSSDWSRNFYFILQIKIWF